ncbi:MAG: DNA-binding protein [Limnoraphis sp. WC205]|jgi:serine/threonine protein kinase|nr:DNA-binding protein [Limnoraphis sp. WC205]
MRLQRQFTGQKITLDTSNLIASGGEGRIFPVVEDSSLVAKVYHKPTEEDADKLTVMYNNPPQTLTVMPGVTAIAWPVDLLCTPDNNRKIVGFLMPSVTRSLPIHTFYTPKTRRERKPLFNYLYLHRTARNLVASVTDLHASGYVIGDVNESNILVSDTALVTLVDTDSFQVRDRQTQLVYRCPVGKAEFTPPELQGQTFRDRDRTPEQDRFGIAVLIFQLLMEGTHPFSGVYQASGDPPAIEARIKAGHFVYGNSRVPYKPMPLAPSFEILHPKLQDLFLRCFQEGHTNPKVRPDARTWLLALIEAEENLVTCDKYSQHRYDRHLSSCPWCERTSKLGGRDPFPSREDVQQGLHLKPLKPKRKRRSPGRSLMPTPSPIQPPATVRQAVSAPASSYRPRQQTRSRGLSPQIQSLILNLMQGAIIGGIWGIACSSAIMAIVFGFFRGTGGILGGMFVGTIWGAFFGVSISMFLPPPRGLNRWKAFIVGSFCGAMIAAAISGILFGALTGEIVVGQTLLWGAFLGLIWGAIWSVFKPPLSLPTPGGVRGWVGALSGSVWGALLGSLTGAVLAMGAVLWGEWQLQMSLTLTLKLMSQMFLMATVAGGLGALGGILSGATFGSIGGVPPLPLSMKRVGAKGAIVGGIWGNFLGVIAGAVLGAISAALFPEVFSNTSGEALPLFLGAMVISAGVGGVWGTISGIVWGALGQL